MSLNWFQIQEAWDEAQATIRRADQATRYAAELAAGRLRMAEVGPRALRQLKRELQNFNSVTGKWRE